jgi:hypothetical protein
MGEIVTLPVSAGTGGSNQDVKTNIPTNRVTDIKPIRNPVISSLTTIRRR